MSEGFFSCGLVLLSATIVLFLFFAPLPDFFFFFQSKVLFQGLP